MKILVACEVSGKVRDAFIQKGHEAISCDTNDTKVPGPHLKCDVREVLYDNWDMIISFPPCTFLTNTGVQWLFTKPGRLQKMVDATKFFKLFLDHPCEKVCIENPIMHGYAKDRIGVHQSQVVQPWMFGHMERKGTCLWLKGLPKLEETNNVRKEMLKLPIKQQKRIFFMGKSKDRAEKRSETFLGIAKAMAQQWG